MAKQKEDAKNIGRDSEHTGRIEIPNVPKAMIKQVDDAADRRGITTASFLKAMIHDYFNRTTKWEEKPIS